jgi:hypothetical protein
VDRDAAQKQTSEKNRLRQEITQLAAKSKPSSTKFGPDDHKEDSGLFLKDHHPRPNQSTRISYHTKNTGFSPKTKSDLDLCARVDSNRFTHRVGSTHVLARFGPKKAPQKLGSKRLNESSLREEENLRRRK